MLDPFRKQLQQLISDGQLNRAFEQLRNGVAAHSEYNKLIITRLCQFQSAKKQFIGGLLSDKEFQLLQTQITHALLIILDEIDENDLNPLPSNAWNQALQDLALGPMGKLHLVNCDRNEPFNSFASFFQKDSALSHQFYFIAGSPTQKPSSFAERIIYEIVEDKQLLDNDLVVEFEHETVNLGDSQTERVKFHPLPIGLNAASSQLKFKKYFSERMGQNHLPVSLDTFFDSRDKHVQFNYIALVFQLESERLNAEVGRYIQWIVEQFRQSVDGQPRFLIFFVIHVPSAKLFQSVRPLPEIQDIVDQASDCCLLIENLKPVSRDAICAWFRSVSTLPDELKIETVIDGFTQQLQHAQRWDGKSDFNMMDVERLLEQVYLHWLKK